ncbi:MAG TPA: FHA domain-containing protein [Candidatus Cryosericum sp.]|nr:FHA domain-containing protein [Candidatus Cryosericum sp.]
MIVTCTSCGRRYNLDPAKLGGRVEATVRCPNCKTSLQVKLGPPPGDETARLDADASLLPAHPQVPQGGLLMPAGMRVSLAVLQGKAAGTIYKVERASTVIGRVESDVNVDDPEVSRQHARLEIQGSRVVLRDLGSTNGTFVNEVKVAEVELQDRSEFRIGGTHFMLILMDEEAAQA